MNNQEIINRLIDEEGLKFHPYTDTVGKTTIGIGRNLTDNGITKTEAIYLCNNDIDNCVKDLHNNFPQFDEWPENVQIVLIDMCFNLGIYQLMKFYNFLGYIKIGNYEDASKEMLNSMWARQVGVRALKLSELLKSKI